MHRAANIWRSAPGATDRRMWGQPPPAVQPRSGLRMQPTTQVVGTDLEPDASSEGAKETKPLRRPGAKVRERNQMYGIALETRIGPA